MSIFKNYMKQKFLKWTRKTNDLNIQFLIEITRMQYCFKHKWLYTISHRMAESTRKENVIISIDVGVTILQTPGN